VMAAITADADPVAGCSSTRLGGMRYRPMATRGFVERWFSAGLDADALARAPVVVFDRSDDLQHSWLRSRGIDPALPPMHHVPSTADYLTAVRLGMGWGMLLDLQDTTGDLVDLDRDGGIDVVLYWQQWRLRSPSLDRVADAVLTAARRELDQR
jgi:LysR family transcriptional regulator (chromosome initiation inhibitor)